MSNVVLYSKAYCPFCQRARALLDSKGVQYTNFDIGVQPELRDEMIAKAGGSRTVPQMFINDEHLGFWDDSIAVEGQGQLSKPLNATLNA
uniref:Glutaredoxin n=1 Tax=Pseudoalteromonas sp. ANT 178 TaxID=1281845 RepID=U5Q2R0_9GAMM|nr:glutaredoxin [Pseudoalteromonas sp. ANT 178]